MCAKVAEAEGLLNAALGEEEAAVASLQKARPILEASGDRLEQSHTLVLTGEILQTFNRGEEVISALKQGLILAERLGRRAVAERANKLLEQC